MLSPRLQQPSCGPFQVLPPVLANPVVLRGSALGTEPGKDRMTDLPRKHRAPKVTGRSGVRFDCSSADRATAEVSERGNVHGRAHLADQILPERPA
jgi:hypothetical protein